MEITQALDFLNSVHLNILRRAGKVPTMHEESRGGKQRGAVWKAGFGNRTSTNSLEVTDSPALMPMRTARLSQVNLSEMKRPLFTCPVQAGFPSPADDYIETFLDLNEHLVSRPSATFFVRVAGESMTGAGILPGDILIVDRSLVAKNGSVVIAVVNDELTVKRLWKHNDGCELHSENVRFPPIKFIDGMELVIWGVVSGVTRKL